MPSEREYYSNKYPSASNSHWLPWLQKQLLIKDIMANTPEIFKAFDQRYGFWKKEFERFEVNRETILVGHSMGSGFIVRWLSDNKNVRVGKVVLVAPWLDPSNVLNDDFFDFEIDSDLVSRTQGITIFVGKKDDKDVLKTTGVINSKINGVKVREFEDLAHFCLKDMETVEFPELLEEILNE